MSHLGTSQNNSILFKLPTGVRNRIYAFSFDEEIVKIGGIQRRKVETVYPTCWNIVVSCKLAYHESRSLFYTLTLFDCNGNLDPRQFLKYAPPLAKKLIQHVFGLRPRSVAALRSLVALLKSVRTVGCYAGAMDLSSMESQLFIANSALSYRHIYALLMSNAPDMTMVTDVCERFSAVQFLVSSDIRLLLPDRSHLQGDSRGTETSMLYDTGTQSEDLRRQGVGVQDFAPEQRQRSILYQRVQMMICFNLSLKTHLMRARSDPSPGQLKIDIDLWLRDKPINPTPWTPLDNVDFAAADLSGLQISA